MKFPTPEFRVSHSGACPELGRGSVDICGQDRRVLFTPGRSSDQELGSARKRPWGPGTMGLGQGAGRRVGRLTFWLLFGHACQGGAHLVVQVSAVLLVWQVPSRQQWEDGLCSGVPIPHHAPGLSLLAPAGTGLSAFVERMGEDCKGNELRI